MKVDIKNQSEELKRCNRCRKPLFKIAADGTIYILKYSDGKTFKVKVTIKHNLGGMTAIGCEECGPRATPHYFVTLVHPTYLNPLKINVTSEVVVTDTVNLVVV